MVSYYPLNSELFYSDVSHWVGIRTARTERARQTGIVIVVINLHVYSCFLVVSNKKHFCNLKD